jgi:hypothetical protein
MEYLNFLLLLDIALVFIYIEFRYDYSMLKGQIMIDLT